MFGICIESSHKKGMGHFFRMLNFIECLDENKEKFIILINEDKISDEILKEKGLPFRFVDLNDDVTNWETDMIKEFKIDVWLNDRLETKAAHAKNVRSNNICLVTIDDLGVGAELSNLHFAAMPCIFNNAPKGEKVYAGIEYIILNKEIDQYRRVRGKNDKQGKQGKLLVTLGGSDTYGATIKVVKILKNLSKPADVIIGPSFKHRKELLDIAGDQFSIKCYAPSLIEEFSNYDIAITGGGITPFEANASGLPCIVIANEPHEMENAMFLEQLGSSVFAGSHDNIDEFLFSTKLDVRKMSEIGLSSINTSAAEKIYSAIKDVMQ